MLARERFVGELKKRLEAGVRGRRGFRRGFFLCLFLYSLFLLSGTVLDTVLDITLDIMLAGEVHQITRTF